MKEVAGWLWEGLKVTIWIMVIVGTVILAISLLLTLLTSQADASELSPPEQCAVKAFQGEFGPLEPWQAQGYSRIMKHAYRPISVRLTKYQPKPFGWNPRPRPYGTPKWLDRGLGGGSYDCRGRRLHDGDLAGSYPYGSMVWLRGKLRRVTDRFGKNQGPYRFDVCCLTAETYIRTRDGRATAYLVNGR